MSPSKPAEAVGRTVPGRRRQAAFALDRDLELDGERAHATSFGLVLRPGPDGVPATRMIGYYVDDLVRTADGRWLFAIRRDYLNLPSYLSEQLGPPTTWAV
jgi:hypothetical protein